MALFPRSADDGMKAVLEMREALVVFNEEQAKINREAIHVGYGLNTGPAMLGTIGEEARMDANVISDAINLASRVESLNKFYGTEFLMSDATMQALSDPKEYAMRLVDKVQVKGKKNVIRLYEVYKNGTVDDKLQAFITMYEAAFAEYAAGKLQEALKGFAKCLELKPQDQSCVLLLERCEALLKSGLPDGWDGTYAMTHK